MLTCIKFCFGSYVVFSLIKCDFLPLNFAFVFLVSINFVGLDALILIDAATKALQCLQANGDCYKLSEYFG